MEIREKITPEVKPLEELAPCLLTLIDKCLLDALEEEKSCLSNADVSSRRFSLPLVSAKGGGSLPPATI